jgi:hypothetical protein
MVDELEPTQGAGTRVHVSAKTEKVEPEIQATPPQVGEEMNLLSLFARIPPGLDALSGNFPGLDLNDDKFSSVREALKKAVSIFRMSGSETQASRNDQAKDDLNTPKASKRGRHSLQDDAVLNEIEAAMARGRSQTKAIEDQLPYVQGSSDEAKRQRLELKLRQRRKKMEGN